LPSPLSLFRRGKEPPDPDTLEVNAVLLASEERPIPRKAIDLAARIAKRSNAPVYVFVVARVWGTSFGFPNPGLQPTRQEWAAAKEVVGKAVSLLQKRGVEVRGEVLGTRRATKMILRRATRLDCGAIVMGADPNRNPLVGDFIWSQEPQRVWRSASVPVYLVTDAEKLAARA
jgi:nucleotide-binding universal stress UspA family protein